MCFGKPFVLRQHNQMRIKLFLFIFMLFAPLSNAFAQSDIARLSWQMFALQGEEKRAVVKELAATNDKSLIPTFVLAMRWTGSNIYVAEALSKLAQKKISHWHEAYEFQELNPQIKPHESFVDVKMKLLGNTDKKFLEFFAGDFGKPENMKIRLEEVTWGGVLVDGITSLDNPKMIEAHEADYLLEDDLVFGVEINGDVRAYPLRIMGWHEMFNDTIGGVPVALAYCTLCGAGILFETHVEGRDVPFVYGSSGLLYRSNKLMFDRETNSLWNQFTGKPVVGALAKSDIALKIRPNTITAWSRWKEAHPNTKVLSVDTGFSRDYGSGVTYQSYFASPDLMFPAVVGDESTAKRKDYVFGIRDIGAAKAWPVKAFEKQPIINDRVGVRGVVLIGDAKTRTVRAYERKGNEAFSKLANGFLTTANKEWSVQEDFLISKDKTEKRARVAGHVAFWFAWDNYLGVESELYQE